MPVYVLKSDSMSVSHRYERSPRIMLCTDGDASQPLPQELMNAADTTRRSDLTAWTDLPGDYDGAIVWLAGDHLLQGDGFALRHHLQSAGRRYFIPVHLPCLTDIDLIGVQPRWHTRAAQEDLIARRWRITGNPAPTSLALEALHKRQEPWARLYLALLQASASPGDGLTALAQLYQQGLPTWLGTLTIRNLLVLLWRQGHDREVETLLREAAENFPGYAEIPYLAACWHLQHGRAQTALEMAQAAIQTGTQALDVNLVGSGGEGSYRAQHLFGSIAERFGNQQAAYYSYLPGVRRIPAFPPSVEGLLRLQLPRETAESLQWDLRRLARSERQYARSIFDFFLRYRMRSAARIILDTFGLGEEEREDLDRLWREAFDRSLRRKAQSSGKHAICLRGPIFSASDTAAINRSLIRLLLASNDGELALQNQDFPRSGLFTAGQEASVLAALARSDGEVGLTLSHGSSPILAEGGSGHQIVLADWPRNGAPLSLVRAAQADRVNVWTFTESRRASFLRAGAPPERVVRIPFPFDAGLYRVQPDRQRPGDQPFTFLFLGPCVPSSGIDVLLRAFALAFGRNEPVRLILQALPMNPLFREENRFDAIQAQAQAQTFYGKQLECRQTFLSDHELAALLSSCDAMVLPSRASSSLRCLCAAAASGVPTLCPWTPDPEFAGVFPIISMDTVPSRAPQPDHLSAEWSEPLRWIEPDMNDFATRMRRLYEQYSSYRAEAVRIAAAWGEDTARSHAQSIRRQLEQTGSNE